MEKTFARKGCAGGRHSVKKAPRLVTLRLLWDMAVPLSTGHMEGSAGKRKPEWTQPMGSKAAGASRVRQGRITKLPPAPWTFLENEISFSCSSPRL